MRILCFCLSLLSFSLASQIDIVEPLKFGEIVILNNTEVSTLEIFNNGTQRNQGRILVINKGAPAVINISGFAPHTLIQLDVSLPITSTSPIGEPLRIIQLGLPNQLRVDNLGNAVITFGGTLATTGTGSNYYDQATYQFLIPIDFTY